MINFFNLIKMNQQVCPVYVNAMVCKFLSCHEQGCSTRRGRPNELRILAWRLSPRDNNRKSLSLSEADSSYGATEIQISWTKL